MPLDGIYLQAKQLCEKLALAFIVPRLPPKSADDILKDLIDAPRDMALTPEEPTRNASRIALGRV